jgi:hypothetical protein
VWMGNCAARRMRWEFSWRSGDAHKTNRFTFGVTVTPTTSFLILQRCCLHLHRRWTNRAEVIMTHSIQTANSWTWQGSQELRNIWERFNY